MDLVKSFTQYIFFNHLFTPKDKLLLTISGGVDSVVLCALCKEAGYDFDIAHCNFQLRGEDSIRDENFVKELAANYDVLFYAKTFDTKGIAKQQKKSIEETARDLRYEWFNELRTNNSANKKYDWIVTAHHADDNIETIAMQFFRGTGIKGLRGMKSKKEKIVRPLLFARKKDLEDYAWVHQMKYVEDFTNYEDAYTRNFFRLRLIPLVKLVYPAVEQNLINNIERFTEAEQLYNQAFDIHKKKLVSVKTGETHIPVLRLKKTEPLRTVVFEIVKDFGFSSGQVTEIIELLDSESGKYVASSTHRIIKHRNWLIISPVNNVESATIIIEEDDKKIMFENGELELKKLQATNYKTQTSNNAACLDLKEISYPLILRKWKQGDYFYPLGMKKKKKIARFLIDQKLSKSEKEKTWVLEMDKKIIWVVGKRIDDRFRISERTKEGLEITLRK